jgi:hypothetical protein
MKASLAGRTCPLCASSRLIFMEHGSGGTVFHCEACSRSTIHRLAPPPIVTPRVSVAKSAKTKSL